MNPSVLAAETLEKDIWYPTILGILVVVFAVALFCGSIYLLLGTNLGARLGFLVAFTALMGFGVILTTLWITTASPLNTLKGRIPKWEPIEIVTDPSKAKTEEIRDIVDKGRKVSVIEAANVKASADETLVRVEEIPTAPQSAAEKALQQKFAKFGDVTEYKAVNTYEIGGSEPNPLDFEFTHKPLFAVVEFCQVQEIDPLQHPFGTPPPDPTCDEDAENQGFLVLERDLGSLRVPPFVAWFSSILLFGLGLLALHWREQDEEAAETRTGTTLAPAPAGS
jgi:hypothetical protein